ncbi:MAG: hypothetical protein IJ298_06995 [Ruminococcus sp.]|nr:hypothetical protein [Ruminococcus sp.]
MKFLRSALTITLCLLLSLTCMLTASAENIKYNLKDLKMSISIPDTMSVRTRDNSDTLSDTIYLEATTADNSLTISVAMIKNEKTQEIYSFENMLYSTLEDYKEQILDNEGYIECKSGEYGGVPFLDFSQKYTTEAGVEVYGKQSVTLVNGMSISITSQSAGDSFTSDELNLIKGCLDSIKFNYVKTEESSTSFWKVFVWIIVILVILAISFLVFSYYMGKRSADKKREAIKEKHRKSNYDVLSSAETSQKKTSPSGSVGGYKSSADYFEEGFDSADSASKKPAQPAQPEQSAPSATEKAVRKTKKAFTHMGYFFSNMKREIDKSKKAKTTGKKAKAKAKKRTKSRDYDVFSDK